MTVVCEHEIRVMATDETTCPECVRLGDRRMHLRLCLTGGDVGCCGWSEAQHASRHAVQNGHPIVGPSERGEAWPWCYLDLAVV